MSDSIWTSTLEAFRDRVASREPVPAGVTVAAVSATLALALLSKVLQVTRNHKDFAGDRDLIAELLADTRHTYQTLSRLADDDVTAFREFMASSKHPDASAGERTDAIRSAIHVPLEVARTSSFGIALCEKARGHIHAVVAPDLGIAAGLLAGAVRSTLVTVTANLEHLPESDPFRIDAAKEASRLSI
jgi:formiminotetrahydrofolate cyclodeaminase